MDYEKMINKVEASDLIESKNKYQLGELSDKRLKK